MSRFDSHFKLTEADAIEYMKEKTSFFDKNADIDCREIGDGNINYVFRVWDNKSEKSIIIKHGNTSSRTSPDRPLSVDRNRIEYEMLILENKMAPGLVPKIYFYDKTMCLIGMEDLSGYEVLRCGLIKHKKFANLADDISTFMAETLLNTTDMILDSKTKKESAGSFINPPLCKITEDLVFTEPYNDYLKRNILFEPNEKFFIEELYNDKDLHLEAARLKILFKTKAQALLHGDLHTGSIFVTEDATKVIDPEFAFYGPIGYDVGNFIANMFFAWINAFAGEGESDDFCKWIESSVVETVELFIEKSLKILRVNTTDALLKNEAFYELYLNEILTESASFTGTELIRRVVGNAKVRDIEGIENSGERMSAERISVLMGKELIKHPQKYLEPRCYIDKINEIAKAVIAVPLEINCAKEAETAGNSTFSYF